MTYKETQDWQLYAANFFAQAKKADFTDDDIADCLDYALRLFRSNLPIIFDEEHLSLLVGYKTKFLTRAAKSPSNFYRHFLISKRSGNPRLISEPLPSLKEVQLWILKNILNSIPVHMAAKAFVVKRSIKENARFHRAQRRVLTLDVKDFFPSITVERVILVFAELGYSLPVSNLLGQLCCLRGCLPQGAPTSPAISNIVSSKMDDILFAYARSKNLRYTRYADDITLSGVVIRNSDVNAIYKVMRSFDFEPNLDKTRLMRPHQRQQVTGIIVNSHLQTSREYRRALRQHAHFISQFGLEQHAQKLGVEHTYFREHLLGKANHVLYLNPNDKDALRLKEVLKALR